MPFPDTVAVPTVVPPLVQVVVALVCGPKTVNLIVPVEFKPELADSPEEIEAVLIAVPAVPFAGPFAVSDGFAFATTISAIPAPQVDAAPLLFESPP